MLGTGLGALTTVFRLLKDPKNRERYDVTMHQIGWKMGGKAATVRNPRAHHRIEEHGMHLFWGFYENTFRTVRDLYAEWRKTGVPYFDAITDFEPGSRPAFRHMNDVTLGQFRGARWAPQNQYYPPNDLLPGTGQPIPGLSGLLARLIRYIAERGIQILRTQTRNPAPEPEASDGLIRDITAIVATWEDDDPAVPEETWRRALKLLEAIIALVLAIVSPTLADMFRLGLAVVRGLVRDWRVLVEKGWTGLDDWDFRDWLVSNGIGEALSMPMVDFFYSNIYSTGVSIVAGTNLYMNLRGMLSYRGAICYEMQAGMAEVVIAPFYRVLSGWGVRFEFFHNVKALRLSADRKSIDSIAIGRQAELKDSALGYQPFLHLSKLPGLDCFPDRPFYDQLVEGHRYRDIDLDHYDGNPYERELVLRSGEDFDTVVLGISAGGLPYVAADLMDASPRFGDMVRALRTCNRMDLQLWLNRTAPQLGWELTPKANLNVYQPYLRSSPIDTWNDFTDLLSVEGWDDLPPEARPTGKAFVGGSIRDNLDHRDAAIYWLNNCPQYIWPHSIDRSNTAGILPGSGIDWNILHSPRGLRGEARIDDQYIPSIPNPSDRYVQVLRGCTRHKLRANESGFRNLYLTGDWILTPMPIGAAENAVMAGYEAANAILGKDLFDGIEF